MRKRLSKLNWVLAIAAVLAVAGLGYYGTRVVYHARVFIELVPGGPVLGSGRVVDGEYWFANMCPSLYGRDAAGRTYFVVERERQYYVFVYAPEGMLERQTRLQTEHSGVRAEWFVQFGVSPSGNRFWIVNRPQLDGRSRGLVVTAYARDGVPIQHWELPDDMIVLFSAVEGQSAYLWTFKEKLRKMTLGHLNPRRYPLEFPMHGAPLISSDGWIWSVQEVSFDHDGPTKTIEIRRSKPGQLSVRFCTSVIPAPHFVMPQWVDHEGNVYVFGAGQRAYHISPDGRSRFMLDPRALVNIKGKRAVRRVADAKTNYGSTARFSGEGMDRVLFVDHKSAVYFGTVISRPDTNRYTYRIYKAELMPRWRGWLLDWGCRP